MTRLGEEFGNVISGLLADSPGLNIFFRNETLSVHGFEIWRRLDIRFPFIVSVFIPMKGGIRFKVFFLFPCFFDPDPFSLLCIFKHLLLLFSQMLILYFLSIPSPWAQIRKSVFWLLPLFLKLLCQLFFVFLWCFVEQLPDKFFIIFVDAHSL